MLWHALCLPLLLASHVACLQVHQGKLSLTPSATLQGGAMAALAVGMQRSGFALKDLPPLRFVVCFAGIRCGPAAPCWR